MRSLPLICLPILLLIIPHLAWAGHVTKSAPLPPAENPSLYLAGNQGDTLPFTLTAYHHLIFSARLNGQDSVRLMFHTATEGLTLITAKTPEIPSVQFDAPDTVYSWGGSNSSRVSQGNTFELGPFAWEDQTIWENEYSGQFSDGKFGLNYFDAQIIELDFSAERLVVHDQLPDTSAYSGLELTLQNGMMFVEADIRVGDSTFQDLILLHSGYGQSLLLNDQFVADHHIGAYVEITEEQVLKDSYGNEVITKKGLLPQLNIGPYALSAVAVGFFEGKIGRQAISLMGGELMQRFDMLIDLKEDRLYLKLRT